MIDRKWICGIAVALLLSFPAQAGNGKAEDDDIDYYRLDCRFHNDGKDGHAKKPGASFCYASAVYGLDEGGDFRDVFLAVGCDNRTLFNDHARVHIERTLDRISPHKSATPGVEVFPHGQLTTEGTYTSVLDIHLGRIQGLCYVHKAKHWNPGKSGKP